MKSIDNYTTSREKLTRLSWLRPNFGFSYYSKTVITAFMKRVTGIPAIGMHCSFPGHVAQSIYPLICCVTA